MKKWKRNLSYTTRQPLIYFSITALKMLLQELKDEVYKFTWDFWSWLELATASKQGLKHFIRFSLRSSVRFVTISNQLLYAVRHFSHYLRVTSLIENSGFGRNLRKAFHLHQWASDLLIRSKHRSHLFGPSDSICNFLSKAFLVVFRTLLQIGGPKPLILA